MPLDPAIRALLDGYVKSITFESNVNTPWKIDHPFKESPPGGLVDAATAALKPKVTIEIWNEAPVVIAPGGEPSPGTRSTIQTGAVIAGVGLAGLLLWSFTRK